MGFFGGFVGPNMTTTGFGGSVGAGTSLSGFGGQLGSGVNTTPTPNLWYKFLEGTGTAFNDSVNGTYNLAGNAGGNTGVWGTLPGYAVTAFQVQNNSTIWNQSTLPTNVNFDGTKPFSVSCWINAVTTPGNFVCTLDPSNSFTGWRFSWENSTSELHFDLLSASAGSLQISTSGANLAVGTTYFVVVTYDGSGSSSGVKFYVNGVLQTNAAPTANTLTPPIPLSTAGLSVASVQAQFDVYNGWLSDLRIYGSLLSSSFVSTLFSAGPV